MSLMVESEKKEEEESNCTETPILPAVKQRRAGNDCSPPVCWSFFQRVAWNIAVNAQCSRNRKLTLGCFRYVVAVAFHAVELTGDAVFLGA